ncbi:MAG: polysaccharide deacetylase family protein, partial [Candidatus Adlerbacteria bacterium]|nr:polysaccharide deacetylase family protein [Candidatus Adlerbacteria bacterium]
MKNIVVTTSWDDGHVLDMRLAALLKKYNIKGTFYIAPKNREIPAEKRLTESQIKELSHDFEIGAHTMTHPRLTRTSDAEAREEVHSSKTYLEEITGRGVTSFCYPQGYYTSAHVAMAKK